MLPLTIMTNDAKTMISKVGGTATNNQRFQRLFSRKGLALGRSDEGRKQKCAGMPFHRVIPVIAVERLAGHRIGENREQLGNAAAVSEQSGFRYAHER